MLQLKNNDFAFLTPTSCHIYFHLASEFFWFQRLTSPKYYRGRQTRPRKEKIRTSKTTHMAGWSTWVKRLYNIHLYALQAHSCAACEQWKVCSNCQNIVNVRRHTTIFFRSVGSLKCLRLAQAEPNHPAMVRLIFNIQHREGRGNKLPQLLQWHSQCGLLLLFVHIHLDCFGVKSRFKIWHINTFIHGWIIANWSKDGLQV